MSSRRDMFSEAKRSEVMSRIKSKYTKLDIAMEGILAKGGFAYEMYPKIDGNPDFLVGGTVVIFCDSGFWHGRNWPRLRQQLMKGSNARYWVSHILKNRQRDRRVSKKLVEMGYVVVRLWDKEIFKSPERCLNRIREALESSQERC